MAKEVLLALGGGGLRGIAHLGVIRCLLDHDYVIKGIAGTSAGGLIGGMYASGASFEEIDLAIEHFSANPSFKRRSADSGSLIGTLGLEEVFPEALRDKNIEDFPIRFVATAVDLYTGREIVIKTLLDIKCCSKTAAVIVSQDPDLITLTSDRIIVLHGGTIIQDGTVQEVFNSPDERVRDIMEGMGGESDSQSMHVRLEQREGKEQP